MNRIPVLGLNPDTIDKDLLTFESGTHKFSPLYHSGEFFALLWCHSPKTDVEMDDWAECGNTEPHCEALLVFDIYGHSIKKIQGGMSIEPSLVCSLCTAHGWLVDGTYTELAFPTVI